MWITFCQAVVSQRVLQNSTSLLYLASMEKLITVKKVKRARKHGFLFRMATHPGQKVIKRRRAAKRSRITI
jgi:ribosomal protein L34